MEIRTCFKRYELKYLLDAAQYAAVREAMEGKTVPDVYGKSRICNLYFDTPDFRIIRHSLEKPVYKEKLRLRSYGILKDGGKVFAELKKKYRSVVYKRRVTMARDEAEAFFDHPQPKTQIEREIAYFLTVYPDAAPAVWLSYAREAFFGTDDPDFRLTFDTDVLARWENLTLTGGIYGTPVLPEGRILMEIKVAGAVPLWLVDCLSENGIRQTSFSKYGTAYLNRQAQFCITGGQHYA